MLKSIQNHYLPFFRNEFLLISIVSEPQSSRQKAVVEAFKHSWKGYKDYAWGHDNVKPISMHYHDWFGLGLTIVDSLDTMYMMGLKDEFNLACDWVKNSLSFDSSKDVNLFEVTIRVLGGLLTTYHFTGDKDILHKAVWNVESNPISGHSPKLSFPRWTSANACFPPLTPTPECPCPT